MREVKWYREEISSIEAELKAKGNLAYCYGRAIELARIAVDEMERRTKLWASEKADYLADQAEMEAEF